MTSFWTPELKRRLVGDLSWRRLGRSSLIIYALLVAFLYFREDALVFVPQASTYHDGPGFVKLLTADGLHITASYMANPQATYTLLYSHGNAEDVGENQPLMQQLHDLGFNVLLYDYHGYGTSEGTPGERTSELDIESAYHYLVGPLKTPANRIIAYGRSVGSGPTLALAVREPVAAVVLESAFTDPASARVPVRLLPWVMFPNLQRITQLHVPVLVLHGLADELIPPAHGKALYAAAPGPKRFLWVAGAGHDNLKEVASESYGHALVDFAHSLDSGHAPKP
jgi:fermentation-respiration switch protein FrsA (DUF1100 family)